MVYLIIPYGSRNTFKFHYLSRLVPVACLVLKTLTAFGTTKTPSVRTLIFAIKSYAYVLVDPLPVAPKTQSVTREIKKNSSLENTPKTSTLNFASFTDIFFVMHA